MAEHASLLVIPLGVPPVGDLELVGVRLVREVRDLGLEDDLERAARLVDAPDPHLRVLVLEHDTPGFARYEPVIDVLGRVLEVLAAEIEPKRQPLLSLGRHEVHLALTAIGSSSANAR